MIHKLEHYKEFLKIALYHNFPEQVAHFAAVVSALEKGRQKELNSAEILQWEGVDSNEIVPNMSEILTQNGIIHMVDENTGQIFI